MTTPSSSSIVQRTLVVLLLASAFLVAGLVSWFAADVLLTLFAGVLVGVLLRGMSQWTAERTGLSDTLALAVVCVAVALAGAGGAAFLTAFPGTSMPGCCRLSPTAQTCSGAG